MIRVIDPGVDQALACAVNSLQPNQFHQHGYALLRGAIPAQWLNELRSVFEAGIIASDQWPIPRGAGWRHALLDLNPRVQAVCHLPALLDVCAALIGEYLPCPQLESNFRACPIEFSAYT